MGVPDESMFFESDDALVSHGRLLAFLLELVLVSLSLDPTILNNTRREKAKCVLALSCGDYIVNSDKEQGIPQGYASDQNDLTIEPG